MKISIITVCRNSGKTLEDTIKSVLRQSYDDLEYIVVDGLSEDNTSDIVDVYRNEISCCIREADNGVYNALNKGITAATGDVVGVLHADDMYADDNVISRIAQEFFDKDIDVCWGDLNYVKRDNIHAVIRDWKSSEYKTGIFRSGWMPPHPAFFVKKSVYEKYGVFDESFRIAADYEFMFRLLHVNELKNSYIPEVLVNMKWGGISNNSVKNIFLKTKEDLRVWHKYNRRGGWKAVFLKNISKIPQFFFK